MTVAFAGPSGVGKSSLLAALTGVDPLVGETEHRTGRTLSPHEVAPGLLDLPGEVGPVAVAALAAARAVVLCGGPTGEWADVVAALGLSVGLVVKPHDHDAAVVDVPDARPLDPGAPAVLHVEAVEAVPGVGVAVTGGVLRGTLRVEDTLQVLPAWRDAIVGALNVGGVLAPQAAAGDRVTVRLDEVPVDAVAPGDALVAPDSGLVRSQLLDVALPEDVRLEHGSTVAVFAGARCVEAEVGWLGGRFHQLRATSEVLVAPWDRVVVRNASGAITGGDALDPSARRHGPSREVLAELARLARERPGR